MARGRRRNGTAPAEQPATPGPPLPPVAPFGISRAQLVALNERKDDGALREHGGVAGLAAALCSDPHRGLSTQGPPGEGAGEGLAPSLHERKEVGRAKPHTICKSSFSKIIDCRLIGFGAQGHLQLATPTRHGHHGRPQACASRYSALRT